MKSLKKTTHFEYVKWNIQAFDKKLSSYCIPVGNIGHSYAVLIILQASFHVRGPSQQVNSQYSTGTSIVHIFSDEEIQSSGFDWFAQLLNGKVALNS